MSTNSTVDWQHENVFGPASTARFDFTLFFEYTVLRILPSVLLLLIVPSRLFYLQRRKPRVQDNVTYFVFAALQLTLLTLWSTKIPIQRTPIVASSFSVIVTLLVLVTSQAEHVRSHKPSTLICIYLVAAVIFDAVICRTLWLLPNTHILASVATATLAIEVTMLIMEMQDKRNHLLEGWSNLGPEATSGIISRGLFWWLNELMVKGFRATLSMSSLPRLDSELQAKTALDKAQDFRKKAPFKNLHRCRLLLLIIGCHKTALLLTIIPRLCLMGFTFAQPFLINRVITYVEGDRGPDPRNYAYGLMGATALVYLGLTFSNSLYKYRVFRSMTMIRACLVSMILDRSVDLRDSSADLGSGALSLMSSDSEQIVQSFENFHEIWANPIEISIAIWFLARIVGAGAIGPAITFLVCTFVLMPPVAKRMGPAMKSWNDAIQKRVSVTSDIVGAVREVKLLGTAEKWSKTIQGLRTAELEKSKTFRWWIVVMNVIANMPPFLAPLLTFGLAIAISSAHAQLITVANVFTSISIMSLIVAPLASLLSAIPNFASSLGSFERIEKFLHEVERNSAINHGETHQQDSANNSASTDEVLTLKNASFGPTSEEGVKLLENVTVSIQKSTFALILGSVGSGKTTLLKALLQGIPTAGSPNTSSKNAAYCAQTPWLTHASIRHNIVAHNHFDEAWYHTVLHATALDKDLEQLESGDQTTIGSKGSALSGGQQQRISLARALYSKQGVYLIDDVLNGLDNTTGAEVWARTFGPKGLLRQQQATVVFATHSMQYINEVDSIILIEVHVDRRTVKQGSHIEMRYETYLRNGLGTNQSRDKSLTEEQIPAGTKDKETSNKSVSSQKDQHEEQDLLRKAGDISLYVYYFKSIGWPSGIVFIGTNVLATIGVMFPQIWLKIWTEANSTDHDANSGWYFGLFALVCILGLISEGIAIWAYFVNTVTRSANSLHWTLLKAVMKAPLSFFVDTDTGDIINRFSQDMSLIDKALPTALFMAVRMGLTAVAEAVLVFLGAKYLAVIVPVVMIMLYALGVFYLRTSRQVRFLDLQAKAPLYTHLLETVDGLATIRAFGWHTAVRDAGNELLDKSMVPYHLLFLIQRWLNVVLDLFVAAAAFLLVTFSVLLTESTTSAYVAIALYNIMSFNSTLAQLISSWTSLETSLGAISRLRDFEKNTPLERGATQESSVPSGWPARGAISVRCISASYASKSQVQETPPLPTRVLNKITFDIRPGEKIGICGRTGSGKSSFIAALTRLLELDEGHILLDGMDISTIDPTLLRGSLIAVPQQPTGFPETIRSYLSQTLRAMEAGGGVQSSVQDDQVLIDALTKVGLWTMVNSYKDAAGHALDAEISGLPLSHGQKQLMCLARALLRRDQSKILLLDEASSAVDQGTEELMMRLIHTEFREHTVLSVAHRLETLRDFDRIIVMGNGEIIETGEPGELLRMSNGRFRELWEASGQATN